MHIMWERYRFKQPKCTNSDASELVKPLSIFQLATSFIIVAFGLTLSLLVLSVEKWTFKPTSPFEGKKIAISNRDRQSEKKKIQQFCQKWVRECREKMGTADLKVLSEIVCKLDSKMKLNEFLDIGPVHVGIRCTRICIRYTEICTTHLITL